MSNENLNLFKILRNLAGALESVVDKKEKEEKESDDDDSLNFTPNDVYKLLSLHDEDERELILKVGSAKAADAIVQAAENSKIFSPKSIVAILMFHDDLVKDIKTLYEKIKQKKEKN